MTATPGFRKTWVACAFGNRPTDMRCPDVREMKIAHGDDGLIPTDVVRTILGRASLQSASIVRAEQRRTIEVAECYYADEGQ